MAAAQRRKVDCRWRQLKRESKAEVRVRLPKAEGRMTKVGLPENTEVVGENTEVDWLSGKRPGDAVSTVYADVIDWQSRRCISSIPRRHFFADEEERCLANRLAVVLRRRKRRLAWRSDVGKRRLGGPPGKRRLACRADQVPTYPCRAKLTKVEADLINSIPGVRAIRSYTSSRAADKDCGKKKTTYPCRTKTPVLEKTALTKTPALETTPITKNIVPNKSRAGTVWTECASKRSRIAQLCDDLSLWSQWRRMLRASTASVPHDASAECCHMNTPSELSLRGINIQYPFSRLILSGVKSVECRRYPLGHRNLAHKNEDLFLIETRGTGDLEGALMESERDFHKRRYQAEADWIGEDRRMAHSQAIERSLPFTWPSHGMREMEAFREMEASREVRLKQEREMVCARSLVESFGPPPAEGQAQVIGIVRFSESKQYHHRRFRPIWSEDRSKHRIKEGGHHDWNGEEPMYAWYVDNVQPLSKPVPAGEYNKVRDQWGYRRPRTLDLATLSFVSA